MRFPGNIASDSIPCEAQRPSKVSNPSVTILFSLSTVKIFSLPTSILPFHQLMGRVPWFWSAQITGDFWACQEAHDFLVNPLTPDFFCACVCVCVPKIATTTPPHLTLAYLPHKARSSPSSCCSCVSHPFPNSPPQQQIRHSLQTRALHAYPHSVNVTLISLLTWHWIMVTVRLPFSIIKQKHAHIMGKKERKKTYITIHQ